MVAAYPNKAHSNAAKPSEASPPPQGRLSTPEAFLTALIASNYDFPAIAAATPPSLLLKFVKDPTVLAELQAAASISNLCLELRHAHVRSIALTVLSNLVQDEDEDPTEIRLAATALLRATKPAAPKSTPSTGAPEPVTEEAADDEQEPKPLPRPTVLPSPALAVEQIVERLIQAVKHADKPEEDAGFATIAAFCDDDAQLNDEPLPTDDPRECIDILADSEISKLNGCEQHFTAAPLTVLSETGPDGTNSGQSPPGQTATCTIGWTPSPGAATLGLTLTLKRAPFSRCPDAWLISALHVGPRPATK